MDQTKIVINSCYGGFSVSHEGMIRYAEIKGIPLYLENDEDGFYTYWTVPKSERTGIVKDEDWNNASYEERRMSNELYDKKTLSIRDFDRTDPVLIQVVEELGQKSWGNCAKLTIEVLEKGTLYQIDEYDGYESITLEKDMIWLKA